MTYNVQCARYREGNVHTTHCEYASLCQIYGLVLPEQPLHLDWYRKGIANNIVTTLWNLHLESASGIQQITQERDYVLVRTHTERSTYLSDIGACAEIETPTKLNKSHEK